MVIEKRGSTPALANSHLGGTFVVLAFLAGAMVWLQYLMGFVAPLILGGIALYLTRGRSFQSATGMLYLCVAFIFIGEVIGRGLLLLAVF